MITRTKSLQWNERVFRRWQKLKAFKDVPVFLYTITRWLLKIKKKVRIGIPTKQKKYLVWLTQFEKMLGTNVLRNKFKYKCLPTQRIILVVVALFFRYEMKIPNCVQIFHYQICFFKKKGEFITRNDTRKDSNWPPIFPWLFAWVDVNL